MFTCYKLDGIGPANLIFKKRVRLSGNYIFQPIGRKCIGPLRDFLPFGFDPPVRRVKTLTLKEEKWGPHSSKRLPLKKGKRLT